jgi:hypothetical protein
MIRGLGVAGFTGHNNFVVEDGKKLLVETLELEL